MDRRQILKSLGVASLVALIPLRIAAWSSPQRNSVSFFSYPRWHRDALAEFAAKVIKESSENWQLYRDRTDGKNPILVTLYGNLAREITFVSYDIESYAVEKEVTLSKRDRQTFRAYLADDHRERPVKRLGSLLTSDSSWKVRGYVKNGRIPDWIMSCEKA